MDVCPKGISHHVFPLFCSKYKTAKEKQLKFWSEKFYSTLSNCEMPSGGGKI